MKNIRGLLLLLCGLAVSRSVLADTPAETYEKLCAVCHLPGTAGAPKVGDRAEWTRRVRAGLNLVYRNALEGAPNTAMMAKGGHDELTDGEFRGIVDFMLTAANLSQETLGAAARYDRRKITNRDFIRLDADYDGALSRKELAGDAVLLKNHARFDANRDGKLGVAEYEKAEATLERERMAVRVDDTTLLAAVREALAKVKGVDPENTKIQVADGAVRMIGIVEDAATARQAYNAVRRIPGVRKIDDRLVSGHQIGWD